MEQYLAFKGLFHGMVNCQRQGSDPNQLAAEEIQVSYSVCTLSVCSGRCITSFSFLQRNIKDLGLF